MVRRRDTGHIAARETSAMPLCASSLFRLPKSASSKVPRKWTPSSLLVISLPCNRGAEPATPILQIHAIPQAACRSGAMRCGLVQLVLTDAEGTSESHSSGRPLPSRWSPRPSSSVVSMRWTRGLQTEVLEHMPPCSAPRWLLIACARICVSSVRETRRSRFVVQCCGTSA